MPKRIEPTSSPSSAEDKPEVEIVGVVSAVLPKVWKDVWPLLEPAVRQTHGRWTEADVYDRIERAQAQLWIGFVDRQIRGVTVSQIVIYPQRKVLLLWLAGGKREGLLENFIAALEDWGAKAGCDEVEVIGRQGWSRVLPGYDLTYWTFRKVL